MRSGFYRAFEERYRGTRDDIKSRLRFYLPFVDALRQLRQDLKAVDLGCGRGEWLELLREQELSALGIDVDDQMLAACREGNLEVETADALAWLAQQPDESCDLVSAFHFVEHLPFSCLEQIVGHCLRVLRPAGLLILETPNPENIVVGTTNFYLDPTHQQPLPPPLLAFLVEYQGFGVVKIVRLQESVELASGREPTLFDVLGGVSPDYAVIAQKQGDGEEMAVFAALFDRDYGIKTDTLAWRYEQARQQSFRTTLDLARQAFEMARQASEKSTTLLFQQQQETLALQQQLVAVYNSSSWRLTEPLRRLVKHFRSLPNALSVRMRNVGFRFSTEHTPKESNVRMNSENCTDKRGVALTPAARQVYADLKAASEESSSWKNH